MQVKQLLMLVRDEPLSMYKPEAAMVMDLINEKIKTRLYVNDHSGTTLLEFISKHVPADIGTQILGHELNDGLDLRSHQQHLQKILEEKNKGAKIVQTLVVLGMCFLLTCVTLVFLSTIYHGRPIPDWEIAVIMFGGPIAVIWQFQGVFSSDNKDFLFAALGKTPPGNMVSTIANAFRGNTRGSDIQTPYYGQRSTDHNQRDGAAPPPPPPPGYG